MKNSKFNILNYDNYPKNISVLYVILALIFTMVILTSNVVAGRLIIIGGIVFPGAVLLFPVAYIFGDILTEVYGFKRSRLIIWFGMFMNIIMSLFFLLVNAMPTPTFWQSQAHSYSLVLQMAPRATLFGLIAYFGGEYLNSAVLSKMKVVTKGNLLWARLVGSTIIGEAFDSAIFITGTFMGLININVLLTMIISQYLLKVGIEVVALPITYRIIAKIKKYEHLDTFDYNEKYNPILSPEDFKSIQED